MSRESIQFEEGVNVAASGLGGPTDGLGVLAAEMAAGFVRAAVQPAIAGYVGMVQGWIQSGMWLGIDAEA